MSNRAQQLSAIPETITRQQYLSLVQSVGFSTDDLRELVFHSNSIEAVVWAKDEDGMHYLADANVPATHRISVRVVD